MKKGKYIIGRREYVDLPELNLYQVEAKIDTGAYTSALHCEKIEIINHQLCVQVFSHTEKITFKQYLKKYIKNSSGNAEERFVIKTLMIIGKRKIRISLSLTDRSEMKYPILIGRKVLKGRFLVDVEKVHVLKNV